MDSHAFHTNIEIEITLWLSCHVHLFPSPIHTHTHTPRMIKAPLDAVYSVGSYKGDQILCPNNHQMTNINHKSHTSTCEFFSVTLLQSWATLKNENKKRNISSFHRWKEMRDAPRRQHMLTLIRGLVWELELKGETVVFPCLEDMPPKFTWVCFMSPATFCVDLQGYGSEWLVSCHSVKHHGSTHIPWWK